MKDLWRIYGRFMEDLWWIYGGFTGDLWRIYRAAVTKAKGRGFRITSEWFQSRLRGKDRTAHSHFDPAESLQSANMCQPILSFAISWDLLGMLPLCFT
jgi:hypothetical protein